VVAAADSVKRVYVEDAEGEEIMVRLYTSLLIYTYIYIYTRARSLPPIRLKTFYVEDIEGGEILVRV